MERRSWGEAQPRSRSAAGSIPANQLPATLLRPATRACLPVGLRCDTGARATCLVEDALPARPLARRGPAALPGTNTTTLWPGAKLALLATPFHWATWAALTR